MKKTISSESTPASLAAMNIVALHISSLPLDVHDQPAFFITVPSLFCHEFTQFYTISRSPNQAPSQKGSSDRGTFSCRSPATDSRSSCTIGAAPFAVLAPLAASTSAPGDFSFPPLRPLAMPLIDSSCTSLARSGRRVKRFQNLRARLGQHMKQEEDVSHCHPQHCLIDQMGAETSNASFGQ